MRKEITPVILRDKYYAALEKRIADIFWRTIYKPIIDAMGVKPSAIKNEKLTPVISALRGGRIYYQGGRFYGEFTSAISRELKTYGASYSKKLKAWVTTDFPVQVTQAIAEQNVQQTMQLGRIMQVLDAIDNDSIYPQFDLFEPIEEAIDNINAAISDTLKKVSVTPSLSVEAKRALSKEWAQNVELYIVDWRKQEILKLRQEVQGNVFQGGRSQSMVKQLQASYGVSKNKAKFLARQETSLLLSKISEQQYKEIGSTSYRWSGSNDARERPDHKALNGKVFRWDDPPITNKETGARNNPGEDFNCRCVAIPIIEGL